MSSAREFDKRKSKPVIQENFSRGMVKNAPHEDIPDGALALLRNAHGYPTEIHPRNAAVKYTDLIPPAIDGMTGLTAYKVGDLITCNDIIFDAADVSNYFVWPDQEAHDLIIEIISDHVIRVSNSGTKSITANCWVHGRLNLWEYHYSEQKVVYQWGTEIYVADSVELNTLTKAICVSFEEPSNTISDWDEIDEYGVIFNSRGTYLLSFKVDPPLIFKKNTPVPREFPASIARSKATPYRYDTTYCMSRLSGNGIRDRRTEGTEILQQSGPIEININTKPEKDYSTSWLEKKIDTTSKYNGVLTGGTLDAAQLTPNYWFGINNGTFRLKINDNLQEFLVDFSLTGFGVKSLDEVALAIQSVIKTMFPFATCYFDEDHFVITTGEENGSEIDYMMAGTSGTSIVNVLKMTAATGATVNNSNNYADNHIWGDFYVPVNSAGFKEWHWTHYVQYRTTDIGYNGATPRVTLNGEDLPPLKFTYCLEVRTCAAFYARRTVDGIVISDIGEFEIHDVGCRLEWVDGDIDIILEYINEHRVRVDASGYSGSAKPLMACAIGGGEVVEASQSGNIVTIYDGTNILTADKRKTITWSTGYYSIVKSIIDSTHFEVYDEIDKDRQGYTYDPISRYINDNISDFTLRARQGELHIGLLNNRFWNKMPNVNIGRIAPGFMVTAIRNFSEIYYCQLGETQKYLSGYYLPNRQRSDSVENSIQQIWVIPNKIIVFCKGSTWAAQTGTPSIQKLPEFGEAYSVLYFDIADPRIGVVDIGSIQEIGNGSLLQMRCADGSWRQFNGFKFTEDSTIDSQTYQDIVKKDLAECWQVGTSIATPKIGHIFWGKAK